MIRLAAAIALAGALLYILKTLFFSRKAPRGEEAMTPIEYAALSAIWLSRKDPPPEKEMEQLTEANADTLPQPGEKQDTKQKEPVPDFISPFAAEFVTPHEELIKNQNVLSVVESLMEMLKTNGGVPSILSSPEDDEASELSSFLHSLRQVTLLEHTLLVTRILMDTAGEIYDDVTSRIPLLLVLGLSHDIGKIEGSPHSSLSAEKLKALIPDDVFWKEKILDAVKKHHSRTDDEYSTLLRKADIQARNYEMARFTPGITVSPLERWFDADEFMVKYLEPLVNVTQTNDTIAFTLNGIVYLKTSAVLQIVKTMASDRNVLDMRLDYPSEESGVIEEVISALRSKKYIHESLKSPKVSLEYEIILQQPGIKNPVMRLTPLVVEKFNLEELEKRKTPNLLNYQDIKLSYRGRKEAQ